MPETTPEYARGVLKNLLLPALEQLSWDGARQIAWLDEHRISEDELALDFDHAFRCRWIVREHGWISTKAEELLKQIDVVFTDMSATPGDRWSDEAILHGPEWQAIRDLADRARQAMANT